MSVAMKAPEIDGPRVSGALRLLEHVHEAHDGADDAHRRGEAAGRLEQLGALLVARGHGVDLDLEDLAHEVRVGAVDDELHALLGEGVLDLLEIGLEGQQAVLAGPLGEADELVDLAGQVVLGAREGDLVERRDLLHGVHAARGQGGAERPDEHEDHRGHVEERRRRGALHHGGPEDPDARSDDADGSCGLHRSLVIGSGPRIFRPSRRSLDGPARAV